MAVSVYTGAGGGVASFNGRKGKVVPADGDYTKAQVGLSNVDNTSDANKPISNATQAALNDKQSKITANGILKGDGSGNITAANETEVELVSLPNICNPNLLDNWYFGNPVNQRGQTEWLSSASATIPCVDRWKWWGQYVADSTLKLLNDGLQLVGKPEVEGLYQSIGQTIEKDRLPVGATVTLSALIKSEADASIILSMGGQNYAAVTVPANTWTLIAGVLNVPSVEQTHTISIQRNTAGVTFTVKAVKLELGSQQTLAHQENGVWVLNEIPDYGEQLRRCQRYLRPAGCNFVVSNASGNWYGSSLSGNSEPMRAVPVIVNGDYKAQPVREVTGGQCATLDNVFLSNIYGQFIVQLSPLGSTIPNYVYVDSTRFNPLLSAEL